MGSTKDYWFEQIEAQRNSRLAKILGITDEELDQITYSIDSDCSNDGLLYGYTVQFDDNNDPIIMAKIKALTSESYVSLSPWDLEDPAKDELEWEVSHSDQLETLNKHLATIPTILQIETSGSVQFSLLVMLHAHVVSALENFLSTTFIHHVTNSDRLTRKLIETVPEFGIRKFTLNEIYAQHSNIKSTVGTYLKDIIYHEMRKVKPLFEDVLSFNFGEIAWLFRAVNIRHDCVHRAGYDKEGNPVQLSAESIKELVNNCRNLAAKIDAHVQEMPN